MIQDLRACCAAAGTDSGTCNAADLAACPTTQPRRSTSARRQMPSPWTRPPTRSDTIYVANHAEGDFAGTVSVINGATCNGTDHTGCGQAPAEDAVGNYPNAVSVDTSVGTAYVANLDDTVSVIPLSH